MLKIERSPSARMIHPGAFSLVDDVQSIIAPEKIRTCRKCDFSGPESLFKKTTQYQNTCKRCDNARVMTRYHENHEACRAQARARYRANIAEFRSRGRQYATSERGRAANRQAVARYRAKYPERAHAVHLVKIAIQRGDLVKPKTCEAKGCECTTRLHAHHADYKRPLDVSWLCVDHHEQVHHEGAIRLKASASRKFARAPKKSGPQRVAA